MYMARPLNSPLTTRGRGRRGDQFNSGYLIISSPSRRLESSTSMYLSREKGPRLNTPPSPIQYRYTVQLLQSKVVRSKVPLLAIAYFLRLPGSLQLPKGRHTARVAEHAKYGHPDLRKASASSVNGLNNRTGIRQAQLASPTRGAPRLCRHIESHRLERSIT